MKRFIKLTLLIVLGMIFYTSAKKVNVPYSIKCYKCMEDYKKRNKAEYGTWYTIANRSFKDEYDNRKMKGYCIYRCQHGHILYVNYDTGDKK